MLVDPVYAGKTYGCEVALSAGGAFKSKCVALSVWHFMNCALGLSDNGKSIAEVI